MVRPQPRSREQASVVRSWTLPWPSPRRPLWTRASHVARLCLSFSFCRIVRLLGFLGEREVGWVGSQREAACCLPEATVTPQESLVFCVVDLSPSQSQRLCLPPSRLPEATGLIGSAEKHNGEVLSP